LHVDVPAAAEAELIDRAPELGVAVAPILGKTTDG
jgi:hypothetical protein